MQTQDSSGHMKIVLKLRNIRLQCAFKYHCRSLVLGLDPCNGRLVLCIRSGNLAIKSSDHLILLLKQTSTERVGRTELDI